MNCEQWINVVKVILDKARPVDSGLYALVVVDGELKLVRKKSLEILQKPLFVFTAVDINEGLTVSRWYSTGAKLAAQKELNPELKDKGGDCELT